MFGVFCTDCLAATGRGADTFSRPSTVNVTANKNRGNVTQRAATSKTTKAKADNIGRPTTNRSAKNVSPRTATSTRAYQSGSGTATRVATTTTTRPARAAKMNTVANKSRAATTPSTNTFDSEYNECRDAYFSCMDQFCAMQNDTYRRCVCSSKLESIKSRTRALSQTSTLLQDFKDLNISVILKTPAEVNAMLTASTGESTLEKTKDTSASAQKITAIKDVLSGTRSNAMSTNGQLDIAGDIKTIWSTTDLASGANIANLTGESLYNAVHAQCSELVSSQCPSRATLNMVTSAYGIYIENDCATILTALDKQKFSANTAIRETEREMGDSRLENYNAHNSASINQCIAKVRTDLTSDVGCGANYVHCLDLTGMYLNRDTGEPIYSENFYKLETLLSLSDNVLTNAENAKYITELNNKKRLAKASLETCRDVADDVWTEFLQQAITEIYQGQQARIRQVKDECLDVVNQCYDETTNQLRDYSKIPDQMLLGDRLELSEEMCKVKLKTCSNLYRDNEHDNGMELLMARVTDQKIAKNCLVTLKEYAKNLCRVPNMDTLHEYPYGCRVYVPGDTLYAQNPNCTYIQRTSGERPEWDLLNTINPNHNVYTNTAPYFSPSNTDAIEQYMCWDNRNYTACFGGCHCDDNNACSASCAANDTPTAGKGYYLSNGKCLTCPTGWICRGGGEAPFREDADCGDDYIGSLYQKMVVYALQYCVRPSASNQAIPTDILGDVNMVMDTIRVDMATVLKTECERMGGEWSTTYNKKTDIDKKHPRFYDETNADLAWGLCKIADSSTTESTQNNGG